MKYIYDYLYLSLAFLGIIAYRYFSQRQFPSLRDRLFGWIIITAIYDLLMDIISSLVIETVYTTPKWAVYVVCYIFYSIQTIFPLLLMCYVNALARKRFWLKRPGLLAVVAPTVATLALLYSNLFTHQLFYVDPSDGYVHGPLFIWLYVNCVFYVILSIGVTIRYRREIIPLERRTMLLSLCLLIAMIAVQYVFDGYLVSGAAIALAVTMMYIVMQKPEDMIDAISGAFNHSALMIFAQNSIDDNKPISLIVLDLLNMRRINRIFGMDFGSRTLEVVSRQMQEVAHGGWVFRTLGNIFVLASNSRQDHEMAYLELCDRFDHDIEVAGVSMSLTATILSLPDTSCVRSVEDLNECLESTLNTTPRSEHTVIPAENLFSDQRKQVVEDALVRALREERIDVAIQPIYSLKQNRFITAEALARYRHETLGNISPAEFIPIAEKNGLILTLDRQIIRKVCRFMVESGVELAAIEVNLSPVEFINEQACTRIIETVREYGVDPSRIWFEITETGVNTDIRQLDISMKRLRAEGFRFALDDYGVGYSNIARIMNLPFSLVKLDRSMLLASMADSRRALIMKSTVQMLRELNLSTLVEGVETEDQLIAMRQLGVDYIQGYYFSKPMPMDEVKAFLERA